MTDQLRLFVASAPGLEPLVAEEVLKLGLEGGTVVPGGVSCFGGLDEVYRLNLGCGLGLRVLVRAAEFFARDFRKLERSAASIEWERWVSPDRGVRVRAHTKRSRLYHTTAIAERVEKAIVARMGETCRLWGDGGAVGPGGGDLSAESESLVEPTLIQVRVVRDRVTISIDTTGVLLHKRGWRAAVAKAPLREDIARALLLTMGWRPGIDLIDPMAGAGTLLIEAGTMARALPPGGNRRFAFMDMPGFDRERLDRVRAELDAGAGAGAPTRLYGSDRDAGAVAAARSNAVRAGLGEAVEFEPCAVGKRAIPPREGIMGLVCNPPWGMRTGDVGRLRNLYASLGKLGAQLDGPVGLVTPDPALARATQLGLERVLTTDVGGVKVGFWVAPGEF